MNLNSIGEQISYKEVSVSMKSDVDIFRWMIPSDFGESFDLPSSATIFFLWPISVKNPHYNLVWPNPAKL